MKLVKEETAGPINVKIYQKEDGDLVIITRALGEVVDRQEIAAVDALVMVENQTEQDRIDTRARVNAVKNSQIMVCGDILFMN